MSSNTLSNPFLTHYATKYTNELGVNSSKPCHIVTCQCIQHNPGHALDVFVTGTVFDRVPNACQIQINSDKLEILVPCHLCNACAALSKFNYCVKQDFRNACLICQQ